MARALGREQGVNIPAQAEVGGTLPPSNARHGRSRGVSTEVPGLRHQVEQLKREVAQLRRNNADTPSVVTRGNATPIVPSSDLAQLKGKIETLEKDLRDTRNKLNFSTSKCNELEARCKAQDGKLKDLRDRVQVLNHTDQVRDKEMTLTQREHSKVTNKVTDRVLSRESESSK